MKKLLVFIGIIALFGCEEFSTCWICSVEKAKHTKVWNEWYQRWDEEHVWSNDGMKTFCQEDPPTNKHHVRYKCTLNQ